MSINNFAQSAKITRNFKQARKKFAIQNESIIFRVQIRRNVFKYSMIYSFYKPSIIRKFMFYPGKPYKSMIWLLRNCLLYTSDAADE